MFTFKDYIMTDLDNKLQRHKLRMQHKKDHIDQRIAEATINKGLIVVNTGNGKGKSSSGFGMVARALGHNMRVGIVQFIKGAIPTGEEQFFRRFPEEVIYNVVGDGFTWDTQDRSQDIASAKEGWKICQKLLKDPSIDLLLLDELNIVLNMGYLDTPKILSDIADRNPAQHVIITGRGAPDTVISVADTVSDIVDVKHAFRAGIQAQRGVEL